MHPIRTHEFVSERECKARQVAPEHLAIDIRRCRYACRVIYNIWQGSDAPSLDERQKTIDDGTVCAEVVNGVAYDLPETSRMGDVTSLDSRLRRRAVAAGASVAASCR